MMSLTNFWVNLHAVVDWMSRSFLLETDTTSNILCNCNRNWFHNHLVDKQTFNYFVLLETYKIQLFILFFMQTFNIHEDWQARITGKLKDKDIILSSMTQITEKLNSLYLNRDDFWTVWMCHGIPCFHFYFFLFRNKVKKNPCREWFSSWLW